MHLLLDAELNRRRANAAMFFFGAVLAVGASLPLWGWAGCLFTCGVVLMVTCVSDRLGWQ